MIERYKKSRLLPNEIDPRDFMDRLDEAKKHAFFYAMHFHSDPNVRIMLHDIYGQMFPQINLKNPKTTEAINYVISLGTLRTVDGNDIAWDASDRTALLGTNNEHIP